MGNPAAAFPRELLNQPWTARIQYFRTYTMAHPCLVDAREALLNAIHEVPPNSLILVLGPTGVGKTTLRAKIEQVLTSEMFPSLLGRRGAHPGRQRRVRRTRSGQLQLARSLSTALASNGRAAGRL